MSATGDAGSINNAFEKQEYEEDNEEPKKSTKEPPYPPTVDPDDEVDLSCGIWKFRTGVFGKWFANLYLFSIFLSISAFFHMMVSGVVHTQINALQRQFNLGNSEIGLVDSAVRIGSICTALLPGHFAKRTNIPVMMGTVGVVQGLVLTIPAILQLVRPYNLPVLTESYLHNETLNRLTGENEKFLCHLNSLNSTNSTDGSQQRRHGDDQEVDQLAYNVLMAVQVFRGLTDSFHAGILGNIYLDDNSLDKTKMGIFIGIRTLIMDLATPLGKFINSELTQIPIDLKDTELTPKDRRFVAAWWMSFLIFGLGTAIFSFPLILYPRRMVSKKQQEEAMKKAVLSFAGGEMVDDTNDKSDGKGKERHDGARRRASTLMAALPDPNSLLEERRSSINLVESMPAVGPKQSVQLEQTLNVPRTDRSPSIPSIAINDVVETKDENIMGDSSVLDLIKDFPKALYRTLKNPIMFIIILDIFIITVPLQGLRPFRTQYMAKQFNVSFKEVTFASGIMMSVSNVVGVVASVLLSSRVKTVSGYMWIICLCYLFTTVLTPAYMFIGCDDYPVYGAEGEIGIPINSSSMCGCTQDEQLLSCGADGNIYYSPCYAGCQNVIGQTFSDCQFLTSNSSGSTLTPGLCPTPCHDNFIIYVVLHGIQETVGTMSTIPRNMMLLRIVEPRDRGFATSFIIFFSLLVSIPAPNLFGQILDNLCYIGYGHQCPLFNRKMYRYVLGGIDVGTHFSTQITIIGALFILKWQEKKYKQKQEAGNRQRDLQ